MSSHLIEGEFQSDKYPTCPRGKVPLSVKDPTAQDLLWIYAQRRRSVDAEFSDDLETALVAGGYKPPVGCPRCRQNFSGDHLCAADHEDHCDIRTTRDGWDADCSCKRGRP